MKQVRLFSTNYRAIIETEFKLVEWTTAKETKKSAIRKFTGFKNIQLSLVTSLDLVD